MDTSTRPSRTMLTSLALLLAMGGGVAPTLLDQDAQARTTLEPQHDPADCPGAHDHRVCSQIQSITAVLGAESPQSASLEVRDDRDGFRTGVPLSKIEHVHPPPRAPPAA